PLASCPLLPSSVAPAGSRSDDGGGRHAVSPAERGASVRGLMTRPHLAGAAGAVRLDRDGRWATDRDRRPGGTDPGQLGPRETHAPWDVGGQGVAHKTPTGLGLSCEARMA